MIRATAEQLAAVKYDANGLVPAIAQDVSTGEVLMMAWMNSESLALTFAEGRMVYWSRSRRELWRKGTLGAPPMASGLPRRGPRR